MGSESGAAHDRDVDAVPYILRMGHHTPGAEEGRRNSGSLVFSGVVNYIENNKLKTVLVASC